MYGNPRGSEGAWHEIDSDSPWPDYSTHHRALSCVEVSLAHLTHAHYNHNVTDN